MCRAEGAAFLEKGNKTGVCSQNRTPPRLRKNWYFLLPQPLLERAVLPNRKSWEGLPAQSDASCPAALCGFSLVDTARAETKGTQGTNIRPSMR